MALNFVDLRLLALLGLLGGVSIGPRLRNMLCGSIRCSRLRQTSRNFSTTSYPCFSMCLRTWVAWFAISSIILRLVWLNHRLFLKKSLWP